MGLNKAIVVASAVLTAIVISGLSVAIELDYRLILEETVEILIPKSFKTMSQEEAKIKYPMNQRPELIFTNNNGGVNIAFKRQDFDVKLLPIEDYTEMVSKGLGSNVTVLETGVNQINGEKVGFVEFTSAAIDSEIYNLMFFIYLEDQLLLCSFNCLRKDKSEWYYVSKQVMNSVKLN